MLPAHVETEIAALASQYGEPARFYIQLAPATFSPICDDDRTSEVCMIVQRTDGRLLTSIKDYYPEGAFRLLTGGVRHGEPIAQALEREIWEETGLETEVARFLAVLEYYLGDVRPDDTPDFATYAFLVTELGGEFTNNDPDERVAAYREIAIDELPAMAAHLRATPDQYSDDVKGSWRDWGAFRAAVHELAYELLRQP